MGRLPPPVSGCSFIAPSPSSPPAPPARPPARPAGSINTIATKLQDNVVVGYNMKGEPIHFRHPAFQVRRSRALLSPNPRASLPPSHTWQCTPFPPLPRRLSQTAAMFLGESLCLLPFLLRRWYKAATRAAALSAGEAAAASARLRGAFWMFALPALCDAGGRTLLNLGLFYT